MAVHDQDRRTARDYIRDTRDRYDQSGSSGRWIAAIIALALIAIVAYMLTAATKPNMIDAPGQTPTTTTAPTTQPK